TGGRAYSPSPRTDPRGDRTIRNPVRSPRTRHSSPLYSRSMALFQSDNKDVLKKLERKEFASTEERDELLRRLESAESTRPRDVIWMVFRPDRAFRDSAIRILQRLRDPETIDVFVTESKGKPDAA